MASKKVFKINEDLYASTSLIDGKGLFTIAERSKGEYLFTAKGAYVHLEGKGKLRPGILKWVNLSLTTSKILDTKNPVVYLNHSCTPNVIIGRNSLVTALRPIEANEELLLDYSTVELDSKWKLNCKCGSVNCRKVIRGFNGLSKQAKNSYKDFMSLRVMSDIPVFTYR